MKCPLCGLRARQLFTSVECLRRQCSNFDSQWVQEIQAKVDKISKRLYEEDKK